MVAKPRWLFIFTDAKYAQSIADGDHHVFTYTQVYNGIRAIEIPFCKPAPMGRSIWAKESK